MRNQSQSSQTVIGTFRAAVIEWRRREGWSRESVVDAIVQAHEAIGGPATTGIVFDPNTRDTFERMKVNADRVFRWLDDETKDSTLLPANFTTSVLAALPIDLRLHCANAILRSVGLEARSSDDVTDAEVNVNAHLKCVAKESTEAVIALHEVSPDAPQVVLEQALKEVEEAQEATTRAARGLKAMLARGMSKLRAA